ncbi:NAD(P)H-binding protein [Georgenia sp. Z1344]|uniref:NmrA family NAD(P)-binding protein n=1 Tax=Georgenia sp. Z1344 TaxID=3416706 RepID=UPI003CFA6723
MYAVAGATGRVGGAAARRLLDEGEEVRVLVRRDADAERWRDAGADARVVDLADRAGLTDALRGAEAMFALLPFDLTADDLDAHADRLTASIAGAVEDAGVPRVVLLSSGGADLGAGTGPVDGLHRLEEALRGVSVLTAMRSGHFQEKVTDVLEVARTEGVYPVLAPSADEPLPLGATADVGAVAAQLIREQGGASEVVDVLGPEVTEAEVAGHLGRALGRELHVVVVPEEAWAGTLAGAGFDAHVAESLAELYLADARGLLAPRGDRTVRVTTPVEETIGALVGGAAVGTVR